MGDFYQQPRDVVLDLASDDSPEDFCAAFEAGLTRDLRAKVSRDRVNKYRIENLLGQPGMGLDPSEA